MKLWKSSSALNGEKEFFMSDNKIRKYRKKMKLTIKDLAERTGLSIGYISQLERDEAEPSLSSLRKIAKEFDVPLYVLIEDEKENTGLTIRREERMSVRTKKNGIEYEFLTPFPSQNFMPKVLMLKITLQARSRDSEIPIVHHSEETIFILKGTLTLTIGEDTVVLREGDTTIIEEDLPHTCANDTDSLVEVLSVISPPVWGTLHFPK